MGPKLVRRICAKGWFIEFLGQIMCSTHTIEMLESCTNSMLYVVMPLFEVVIEISCVYCRLLAWSSIVPWFSKLELRN